METEFKPPRDETIYRCFDRSFKVEIALFMVFVPTLIILWIFAAYYYYYMGRLSLPLNRAALYCTAIFVFALIFYGNARAMSKARLVIVNGDRVARKNGNSVSVLSFSGVSGVRGAKNPFRKKWMVLESPEKKLSVPLCIRDGHEMVEKVFGGLEANGLFFEGLADLRRRFRDTAKRFNILYNLRYRYAPNLIRAATAAALLNGGVAIIFWGGGLLAMIVCGFFNMLLQAAAYFLVEGIHAKKLLAEKEVQAGGADGSFSGYYVMAGLFALLFGMALGTLGMAFGIFVREPA